MMRAGSDLAPLPTVSGADGRHERVGTPVVAGVDAPPVLELAEHVLDLVTLAVERPVILNLARNSAVHGGEVSASAQRALLFGILRIRK